MSEQVLTITYKVINVDEDNNALLHNICFSYSEYDRGKFIEF